jgi:hypothetical protein
VCPLVSWFVFLEGWRACFENPGAQPTKLPDRKPHEVIAFLDQIGVKNAACIW